MEKLVEARKRLSLRCLAREEEEQAVEVLCLRAISGFCARTVEELERQKKVVASKQGTSSSTSKMSFAQRMSLVRTNSAAERERSRMKDALQKFYEIHNREKLPLLDKVCEHFAGRVPALNEALILQYGEDLSNYLGKEEHEENSRKFPASNAEVSDTNASEKKYSTTTGVAALSEKIKMYKSLFRDANEDFYLPSSKYRFRFGSESAILGLEDFWIEELSATVRADLCVKARPWPSADGGRAMFPQLSFGTEKKLRIKCRTVNLKFVNNIYASTNSDKGRGKVYEMENLDIEAEISFYLPFLYFKSRRRRGWKVMPNAFKFEITKLKTQRPMIDPILRAVANSAFPAAIISFIEKYLIHELGLIMLDSKIMIHNQKEPMGVALLLELAVRGWPSTGDFHVDLYQACKTEDRHSRSARNIMKKIGLTQDQLETLNALNRQFQAGVSSDSKSSKSANGVFPLSRINLESLVALCNGLFVGDLVGYSRARSSSEETGLGDADTDDGLLTESEGGGTTSEEDIDFDEEEEEQEAEEQEEDNQILHLFPDLAPFKASDWSQVFPGEYSAVISHAASAQAEAQERLDRICDELGKERWSLSRLIENVQAQVCSKRGNVELNLHALDLRFNADVLVDMIQEFSWRDLKRVRASIGENEYKHRLDESHKVFTGMRLSLIALKSLAGNMNLTCTGAVTGGKSPSFEASLKNISSEGVIDLQLGNLRLGGNFKEFVIWFFSYLRQMRSRSALSRKQRMKSVEAMNLVSKDLLKHLEIMQFFLDGSLSTVDFESEISLIFALTAQKENPRPPLSLQVNVDLLDSIPKIVGVFQRDEADEAARLAFKFPESQTATGFKFFEELECHDTVSMLVKNVLNSPQLQTKTVSRQQCFWILSYCYLMEHALIEDKGSSSASSIGDHSEMEEEEFLMQSE